MDQLTSLFLGPVDPLIFLALLGVIFGGAFITSAFGMGGGLLMTPLALFLLPPKFGIGLIGPMMFLMAATGVRQYWKHWDNRCLLILLPAMLVGTWVGTYLLAVISPHAVKKMVGGLALGFGALHYLSLERPAWREKLRPNSWQGVGLGFASGAISAMAHVGGIIFSFYLIPHSRTKEAFVGTTVFLFFASGLLKMGTYTAYGLLTFPILMLSLALLPALFLGSIIGKWVNRRISHGLFIRLICIFVGLMGIWLLIA